MKTALIVLALSFSVSSFAKDLIVNFSKVNDGIYRGSRLESEEAVIHLNKLDIKNVINLQGGDVKSKIGLIIPWAEPGERPEVIEREKARAILNGMGYMHVPLNSLSPIDAEEDKAIDDTLAFMNNKENQPLFIHCEHGADRTGLLVALYRVKYEKVDPEIAKQEWYRNGHNRLHQLFTGDLDKYFEEKIKEFNQVEAQPASEIQSEIDLQSA